MTWLLICELLYLFGLSHSLPLRFRPAKNDILPPDHMDAVKLERDSHLNRDYKREIFFGEDHEQVRPVNSAEVNKVLTELFHKVDNNHDKKLSMNEISTWIKTKIEEHMNAAIKENEKLFALLDQDKNGMITWREFIVELMIALGHNKTLAKRYPDNYSLIPLGEDDTIVLSKNRYRWSQADADEDNALNKTEFLSYRHPELSQPTLLRMADDLIVNLDEDKDGMLSLREFARIPKGHVEAPPIGKNPDNTDWQQRRSKEFQAKIDLNGDGLATRDEMIHYVDPRSVENAKREAANLVSAADHDHDEHVSLEELLENHDLILGSALFNTGSVLHEEL